jgi:hypothetical protein
MAITRNFKAEAVNGATGPLLIVSGEANTGKLDVMPSLSPTEPQGINPTILFLNLEMAVDDVEDNFKEVEYTRNLKSLDEVSQVDIFFENKVIEHLEVKIAY